MVIKDGRCPVCDSELDTLESYIEDNYYIYRVECEQCGWKGSECYRVVFEMYEDDD